MTLQGGTCKEKEKTLRSQWLPTLGGWGEGEKEVGGGKKTMKEMEPFAGGRTSNYGVIVYRKSGTVRRILKGD